MNGFLLTTSKNAVTGKPAEKPTLKKGSSTEMIVPVRLWTSLAVIGCALTTVTTLSIRAGPSASEAIIAIRVAHQELFWGKIAFRDPAVHEAEFHLDEAWSKLRDRQYEQSVFAAYEALQRVRDVKGGIPSLYSSHWERKQIEPASSPES
jgi:hypothetical protein